MGEEGGAVIRLDHLFARRGGQRARRVAFGAEGGALRLIQHAFVIRHDLFDGGGVRGVLPFHLQRLCALESRPGVGGDDAEPVAVMCVDADDPFDAGHGERRGVVIAADACADAGGHFDGCVDHVRQLDVDAKDRRARDLGAHVQPPLRLADDAPVFRIAQAQACGRLIPRRVDREVAIRNALIPRDHVAGLCLQRTGADAEPRRRRRLQHLAGGRPGGPHLVIAINDGGGPAGPLHAEDFAERSKDEMLHPRAEPVIPGARLAALRQDGAVAVG